MQKIKETLQEKANLARDMALEAKREIDSRILSLTAGSLDQVRRKISESKAKWEVDRDYALSLATKILDKAREVRESLRKEDILAATEALKKTVLTKVGQSKPKKSRAKKSTKPRARKTKSASVAVAAAE